VSDVSIDSELLTYPRPDELLLPETQREPYRKFVAAVTSVKKGMTVRTAARLHNVNRGTLASIMKMVDELATDGRPWGFRACVRWRRKVAAPESRRLDLPAAPGPHAFVQLLTALPELAKLVAEFRGNLPKPSHKSPAFEELFKRFKTFLRQALPKEQYPLNRKDKGRRALMRHIHRKRCIIFEGELLSATPEAPDALRLADLILQAPLDRVEVDGHKTDVNWRLHAPGPQDTVVVVEVPRIWLLAMIDSVSFVVFAWHLVVARRYTQTDLLELHARALTPWAPRILQSPDMRYDAQAWMPTFGAGSGDIVRPICVAMDNDSAHTSHLSTEQLAFFQRGFVNLDVAGIPERRPHIEAFFKMIEERVYRRLAGGFRPAGAVSGTKTRANALNPSDYPLELIALEDLMDVVISSYNVTAHTSLQGRSPRDVHEAYLRTQPWINRCSQTAEDVRQLRTLRKKVWIRGSRKDGVLPHVNWEHGIYRSARLKGRWDLIGKTYWARVLSTDLREMGLYDEETGELVVVLRALPPWHRSPHDLYMRRRAKSWRDRGLIKYEMSDDAIEAYHAYVHAHAWRDPLAAEGLARQHGLTVATATRTSAPGPVGNALAGLVPRTGPVTFLRPRRSD
jgi:putative transposase